ncbi:hypothetical protein KAX29_03390 [candidate division WOR-3 bacterium]|nr:hypothetical protein [candidate division WOR-3 bacterium]
MKYIIEPIENDIYSHPGVGCCNEVVGCAEVCPPICDIWGICPWLDKK